MKTIHLIIFVLTLSLNINAQTIGNSPDLTSNPFIGTWEYQENNTIFRVKLKIEVFEEHNDIAMTGHYQKVSVDSNGNENIIYNSEKYIGPEFTYLGVIYGSTNYDDNLFSANIRDNTLENPQVEIHGALDGRLTMQILSENPVTAQWRVKKFRMSFTSDNRDFSFPTDIILTKVE